MNGLEIVRGLIERGYSPHQAAALAGHMLQESGGDPNALNKGEGANGLMQWRLDRWDNLQNFARAQGKSPNDPNVQLDFVGKELAGPEARAGRGFLEAKDVNSASAALKNYIRFGDDSADTRLRNSVGLLNAYQNGGAPVDPVNPGNPTTTAPLSITGPVGQLASAAPVAPTTASILQDAGAKMGGGDKPQQVEFLAPQQLQMLQPRLGQSQQIAAAIAKAYGIGG